MGKFDADPPNRGGEYRLVPGRDNMIDVKGMGRYGVDEIPSSIQAHKDEGDTEGAARLSHLQGALFDTDAMERTNRVALGRSRLTAANEAMGARRDAILQGSDVPTSHLQPRPPNSRVPDQERPESALTVKGGEYKPESYRMLATPKPEGNRDLDRWTRTRTLVGDEVAFPMGKTREDSVLIHEMGHRHHFSQFPHATAPGLQSPLSQAADPLYEGHADAYVDRFLPQNREAMRDRAAIQQSESSRYGLEPEEDVRRKYEDFERTGYSTNFQGDALRGPSWSPTAAALYAGTRAHFGQTGEIVQYETQARSVTDRGRTVNAPGRGAIQRPQEEVGSIRGPGYTDYLDPTTKKFVKPSEKSLRETDPTIDATVAMLMEHSPHARQAMSETRKSERKKGATTYTDHSLGEAAEQAVRRHKDRTLLRTGQYIQDDLFGDTSLSHNQFGEAPRTVAEVKKTLRIKKGALGPGETRGLL